MRWISMILIFAAPVLCFGQENHDDLKIRVYGLPDSVAGQGTSLKESEVLTLNKEIETDHHFTLKDSLAWEGIPKVYDGSIKSTYYNAPGTAYIPLWRNGGLLAMGNRTEMPGLMLIDSGSIGLMQNVGRLSLYFGGVANKYGYFNGLHTQYGVNGTIRYDFSSSFSATGFGTYYFGRPPMMANGSPMPPSMIGYFGVSTFGGYVSYQINETFGVDVGAQAVQRFGTDKYRLEPIVTPTVKMGKVSFGLPVGQILNGIIQTQMEGRRGR